MNNEESFNITINTVRDYWKSSTALKKIMKELTFMNSPERTCVTLYVSHKDTKEKLNLLLIKELGKVSEIKNEKTRDIVRKVLDSLHTLITNYDELPDNGLIIFHGQITDSCKKISMMTMTILASKPLNTSLFVLDDHYHVYQFKSLFREEEISDDSTVLNVT